MSELLKDIFDIWRDASYHKYLATVDFTIMYTHTAEEFIKLLHTWRVPFEIEHVDPIRVHISTLDYWYVMSNKDYYSDNGITAEMESEYYA